jgi:hypothetical protein
MKFKELILISLGFIVLLLFITSVVFLKFNLSPVAKAISERVSQPLNTSKKSFNDSKFLPKELVPPGIEECNTSVKVDKTNVEYEYGGNDSAKRLTLVQKGQSTSGVEIMCVKLEQLVANLKTNIDKYYLSDPAKATAFFGGPKEQVYTLSNKDLYALYLVKLNDTSKNCTIRKDLKAVEAIQTELESLYQDEYLNCDINSKQKDGSARFVNYRYFFTKDNQRMLQVAEVNFQKDGKYYLLLKE